RRRPDYPDVIVVGTDPPLSILTAWTVRTLRPPARFAHWCFDLYPEAAVADGLLFANSRLEYLLKKLAPVAYSKVDLISDCGGCMRKRWEAYSHSASTETLVPWALLEPRTPAAFDLEVRSKMFGTADLGLLYSGNYGRAHAHEGFLALARMLQPDNIAFAFGM